MSVLRLLQSHVGNRSRSIPMLHTHYCGYFARHSVASPSTSSGKLYYRLLHAASTTQQHSFLLRHVTRLTSSTTPHQTHWPHSTCLSSQSNSISTASNDKHRLVFLGTPEVAALVLNKLLDAAAAPDAQFEVTAVVTQPGRPKGRGNRKVATASPVEEAARAGGVEEQRVLCPVKANEDSFIQAMRDLQPDLCVTAAYGNVLPQKFLDIPRCGTLNIHPSLLPLYRGAAPVQRALEDGVSETGVSVAYTVRAMDAGPVLRQVQVPVDLHDTAPDLLDRLFLLGTDVLLECLPSVWDGSAPGLAVAQDASRATHAAKLTKEQGMLDFTQPARVCHNKVQVQEANSTSPAVQPLDLKIVSTKLPTPQEAHTWATALGNHPLHSVVLVDDTLVVQCADASLLGILQVQAPGKRAVNARAFANGLVSRGAALSWVPAHVGGALHPRTSESVAAST